MSSKEYYENSWDQSQKHPVTLVKCVQKMNIYFNKENVLFLWNGTKATTSETEGKACF